MDVHNTNLHRFMLYSAVFFITMNYHVILSQGADRITRNQSLSGDQTIMSSGGFYKLGFFRPGKASNYYVGIWYNEERVSKQTFVWVANRESPVTDRFSSELRFTEDGNLVLFNETKSPIWSTNVSSGSNVSDSLAAVLNDLGNFVLRDGSTSTAPLWQSVDHPTDTWLPSGKLGVNKKTGERTVISSWRNKEDPAPGLFSLELDPGTSQYFILWNRTQRFWRSGSWNGEIFASVPEMRRNYIYNFTYVDNENESYFTYSLYNTSLLSRFIMDFGGQIQQLSWLQGNGWNLFWSQPKVQCDVYGYCGAFGSCTTQSQPFCTCLRGFDPKSVDEYNSEVYSGGCVRRTSLQCGNSSAGVRKPDRFFTSYNTKLPENPQTRAASSASDCEQICLSNCSCTAYAFESNECQVWFQELLNLQQLSDGDINAKTLYVRLAATEFSSSKNNKGIIIGVVAGSVVLVLLVVLLLFLYLRRRNRRTQSGKAVEGSLVAFGYRDLQNATKNFSEKLGGGGFGSVFKGVLPDSSLVGVKKLESVSQGEKQFRTEVSTIGTIQHVNLVRLRGFCSDSGNRKLLVYDFMPNGSLDAHLFQDSKVLDWKTRYNTALGTARGLTYLHEKCRDCIIHCDIKPENILLDSEFCPKVADFGLAKLMGREFSRVLTTMRGTRGYLAPEWISGVAITAKADVYSYGMMLFELVSGRRNSEQSEDGKMRFFPTWAATHIHANGDVLSLLDPKLERNADPDELTRICKIACWCIQDDENQRPSMGQVVQMLEGILSINVPPIPRSLQLFIENNEHVIFFTSSSSSSNQTSQANKSNASSAASSQIKSSTSSTRSKT